MRKTTQAKKASSGTFLLLIFIGFGFLFLNIWFINTYLPKHTIHHPLEHPHIYHIHDISKTEEYWKQFIEYPLPCHILRNVSKYGIKRIVAIGDLHGDINQTVKLLKLTNIINEKTLSWNTTDTILIQTGDIVDRGLNSIKIYQLFNSLRIQSVKYNSIVFNLLGNHEINNLNGIYEHTNSDEIKNYGGNEEWSKLFSLENKEIGYRLRNAPIVMIIGNTLFCHAGLRSVVLNTLNNDIEELNKYSRLLLTNKFYEILDKYKYNDKEKQIMTKKKNMIFSGRNGPIWTRAFEPYQFFKDKYLMKDIKNRYGDELVDYCLNDTERTNEILKPLIKTYICDDLDKTLKILNSSRMIKGHDPQLDGKISIYCNKKYYIIDVGISKMYQGGHIGAIQIDLINDNLNIIGESRIY